MNDPHCIVGSSHRQLDLSVVPATHYSNKLGFDPLPKYLPVQIRLKPSGVESHENWIQLIRDA